MKERERARDTRADRRTEAQPSFIANEYCTEVGSYVRPSCFLQGTPAAAFPAPAQRDLLLLMRAPATGTGPKTNQLHLGPSPLLWAANSPSNGRRPPSSRRIAGRPSSPQQSMLRDVVGRLAAAGQGRSGASGRDWLGRAIRL
jgi:hypothetical protein